MTHGSCHVVCVHVLAESFSGVQSTVDEMCCGVASCLPFVRSVLQNQLLQSAKTLNEVRHSVVIDSEGTRGTV